MLAPHELHARSARACRPLRPAGEARRPARSARVAVQLVAHGAYVEHLPRSARADRGVGQRGRLGARRGVRIPADVEPGRSARQVGIAAIRVAGAEDQRERTGFDGAVGGSRRKTRIGRALARRGGIQARSGRRRGAAATGDYGRADNDEKRRRGSTHELSMARIDRCPMATSRRIRPRPGRHLAFPETPAR
jgi:hypothetical protein